MKRILLFITGLGPGGAERQLTGLAIMLKEQGYIVQVCWYTDINFYQKELIEHNVDCRKLFTHNHIIKVARIWLTIRDYHPDIVISFLDGPNTICPLLKLISRNFKLIVSERNTTQRLDWRTKLRFWAYRQADFIVPNSISQKDFIEEHYPFYKEKVVTISNFTDLKVFVPPITKEYKSHIKCLVAARVTEPKNVKRFIHSVRILHTKGIPITVKWFGLPYHKTYQDECEKLIKEQQLEGVFSILPPTKDILAEYHKCDVVCLPSLFEGFPNVICEAMCCGLPVICSDICDNSLLVSNGVNGFLFNPLSEEDMAEKIEMFCGLSIEERKRFGDNSRQRAEKMLSKEVFIQKYIELIETLNC